MRASAFSDRDNVAARQLIMENSSYCKCYELGFAIVTHPLYESLLEEATRIDDTDRWVGTGNTLHASCHF